MLTSLGENRRKSLRSYVVGRSRRTITPKPRLEDTVEQCEGIWQAHQEALVDALQRGDRASAARFSAYLGLMSRTRAYYRALLAADLRRADVARPQR
jgi:hypothetical protein